MNPSPPRPRVDSQFLGDLWAVAKPYWVSERRWTARGLAALVIGLLLLRVLITVRLVVFRGALFDAMQAYDINATLHQLLIYAGLATLMVATRISYAYVQQVLQIGWRRWLTERYLGGWLAHKAYYRMELIDRGTDNPDQRIQEDLNDFPDTTMGLILGAIDSVVTLASFVGLLWSLTGSIAMEMGPLGLVHIPGFGVWAALIYSVAGTWITFKVGRPLVALNFFQQRYEADYRYALARVRENAENIAFFGGEDREIGTFRQRFGSVFVNYWAIMNRTMALGCFTYSFNQAADFIPMILGVGPYFSKRFGLGGIGQLFDAFDQVQSSLAYVLNSYTTIAQFQSVVVRLATFSRQIEQSIPLEVAQSALRFETAPDGALAVEGLHLDLPGDRPLLDDISLEIPAASSTLLTGPSGVGKSTLLRALAHLWPFARGTVRSGLKRPLFLPQKPYLPTGSLRQIVLYPHGDAATPDAELAAALTKVGLGALTGELDHTDSWSTRLSLGEQQRLNFARILLQHPDGVFMDEATSALDEPAEAQLYGLLNALPARPTILSIGHRSTLKAFHDRVVTLAKTDAGGALVAAD